jgi:hypothetical protein
MEIQFAFFDGPDFKGLNKKNFRLHKLQYLWYGTLLKPIIHDIENHIKLYIIRNQYTELQNDI